MTDPHARERRMHRPKAVFPTATLLVALLLPAPSARADQIPVEMRVPVPPSPVASSDGVHLIHELHLGAYSRFPTTLERVEVLGDEGHVLAEFAGEDLAAAVFRPGRTEPQEWVELSAAAARKSMGASTSLGVPTQPAVLEPGATVVVMLDAVVREGTVPRTLTHRVTALTGRAQARKTMDGPPISVAADPVVIEPPLRGERWFAFNALGNESGHRRQLMSANGRALIIQRYAVDWVRLNEAGAPFDGDPKDNASYIAYGEPVLAVADGTVVSTQDGIPENVPTGAETAVPITEETIAGNHVMVDLGSGRYATFMHMQPGSVRVKVGDRVRAGDVLGNVGNSGNSTAPHLHFHVSDRAHVLYGDGLPYVLTGFRLRGVAPDQDVVDQGGAWLPDSGTPLASYRNALPRFGSLVDLGD